MNHDPDWKLFLHFWNRLTPHQRRIIVLKARLYKFEQQFYLAVIYATLFIISLLVPIPRRLQPRRAHYL